MPQDRNHYDRDEQENNNRATDLLNALANDNRRAGNENEANSYRNADPPAGQYLNRFSEALRQAALQVHTKLPRDQFEENLIQAGAEAIQDLTAQQRERITQDARRTGQNPTENYIHMIAASVAIGQEAREQVDRGDREILSAAAVRVVQQVDGRGR